MAHGGDTHSGPRKTVELLAGVKTSGETNRAVVLCNDFLRMGPGRSTKGLLKILEPGMTATERQIAHFKHRNRWDERAVIYDQQSETEKNFKAREMLSTGLALTYNRVAELKALAEKLTGYINDEDRVWLTDVKILGLGHGAKRIDVIRFNYHLIDQFRETLNDLALEVGGRVRKTELANPEGETFMVGDNDEIREKLKRRFLDVIDSEPFVSPTE